MATDTATKDKVVPFDEKETAVHSRTKLDALLPADPRAILTGAISVAKKRVFKQPLNKGQVAVLTDKAVKSRTKW